MRSISVLVCLCVCTCARAYFWDGNESSDEDPTFRLLLQEPGYEEPTREQPEVFIRNDVIPEPEPAPETPIVAEGTVAILSQKLDNLMSEVKSQQDKITALEISNRKLQDKVDYIEQQVTSNSLIFSNIPETKHESHKTTLQKVLHLINKVMKVKATSEEISAALRMFMEVPVNAAQKHRPVLVRFTTFATRMRVLAARSRLRFSNMSVSAVYSERVAETRRLLMPYLELARAHGHNAFLLYDSLVVDGVRRTLAELEISLSQQTPQTTEVPDEQVEEVEVDPVYQENDYYDDLD